MSFQNKMKEWKEEIPNDCEEYLEKKIGEGKSPTPIFAAIEYLHTTKPQQKVAREYDTDTSAIRERVKEICDYLGIKNAVPDDWDKNRKDIKEEFDEALKKRVVSVWMSGFDIIKLNKAVEDDSNGFASRSEIVRKAVREKLAQSNLV